MKRIVSWLMAVMLFAGASTLSVSAATDMNGHWAQDIIENWVNKGFVSGYPDGTFRPDNNISRAEFSSIINKAFGLTAMVDVFYSDVSPTDWFYSDVSKGLAAGYLDGYGDGTIRPGNPVTREDAAMMLTKLLNLTLYEAGASRFVDVESGRSTRPYIGAVVNSAIMQGYSDNTFRPENQISRAEALVCLNTAFNSIALSSARYILPSYEHQVMGNFANLANAGVPIGSYTTAYNNGTASGSGTTIREKVTLSDSNYGSSGSRTTVAADMEVTSTSVTIRNTDISGDLVLSSRTTGTVSIIDSNIDGEIYVYGRPSITLTDTTVKTINVDSNTSTAATRITARNASSIKRVNVYTPVTLTESSLRRTSDGFQDVYIMSTMPRNARVSLSGDFETVEVDAERIRIDVTSGTIEDMRIEKDATNCTIALSVGATINSMDIDARYTTVTGSGRINTAYVNAQNVTLSRRPTTVKGSEVPSYNFTDDEGDGNYSATFYVKSSEGYNLRNAYIVLTNTSTSRMYTGYTDQNGEAQITNLPYGTYDVWVTSSDYMDYTGSLAITRNVTQNITLSVGYSFNFFVKDSVTGGPIKDVHISVGGLYSGTTDANGNVSIGIPYGTYSYTATKTSGYQQASGNITVAAGSRYEEVLMTPNATTPTSADYKLTVTASDTGTTPAGTAVKAIHTDGTTVTGVPDASGVATLHLKNGTHDITVTAPNYDPGTDRVTINGAEVTATAVLSPSTPATHNVTITVKEVVTGTLINGAEVFFNGTSQGYTNASGVLALTGVPESSTGYSVTIQCAGYDPFPATSLVVTSDVTIDYELTPTPTIPTYILTINVTGTHSATATLDINIHPGTDNTQPKLSDSVQYVPGDPEFDTSPVNITLPISGLTAGNYFIEILEDGTNSIKT